MQRRHVSKGFTIVELLIAIVIIAVLARVTIVAFNGVQAKGRDADRRSDISAIKKALEQYYSATGTYPTSTGSTTINASWVTTADASWANFVSQLVPSQVSVIPRDPREGSSTPAIYGGFHYDYIRLQNGWCGTSGSKPGYLLTYRLESSAQERKIEGDCPGATTQPTDYSSSEYVRID